LITNITILYIQIIRAITLKHLSLKLILFGVAIQFLILSPKIFPGTIKGIVRNTSDHSVLPGANVIIKGTTRGVSADTNGFYLFNSLSPGTYTLEATAVGFGPVDDKVTIKNDESVVKKDFFLKEKPINLTEVIVEARANKELESTARETEKDAENEVNVISAEAIEQSTDKTAADVLQRVSGMSVMKDNTGEGQYVVMRGLAQQYNNTLVDGIKIPSPESKDRFVPMDIFPSALFENIEVTKSLTPETAGDAIGGSTDLMLREAPENFIFSVSAAAGYSASLINTPFNTFDKNSVNDLDPQRMHGTVSDLDPTTQIKPRYNPVSSDFTTNNLIFTNKTTPPDELLSGIIGDRFFDGKLGFIAAGSYQNTYDKTPTDFYTVSSDINKVDAEGHLTPYAATYDDQVYYTNKIRDGAVVKADYIADEGNEFTATYLNVRQEEDQVLHGLQVQIDGERGAADLTYTNRSAIRTQTISSISLNGENFSKSILQLNWTLNYTDAVQDRPDEAEYTLFQNYGPNGQLQPFQGLDNITHDWRKNDDNQYLGKVDAILHITPDNTQTFQAGILTQKLTRANYEDDYQLNPALINGHTQPFTSIDSAVTTVFGSGTTSGSSVYGYQNYKAREFLISSYFEYTAVFGQLQILGGLRWEQAADYYFTMASADIADHQANVKMVNFLPGIHFKYSFTQEQIGRLSITQSMSRPSYFDLVPAVDRSDESETSGNPGLRPAVSVNIDLRYEYYPNSLDVYSLGLYSKKIEDPIEDEFQSVGVVLVTSKVNGDPATVYGTEAVLSKHFGDLGITANYSYVFSQITSIKQVTTEDINGDLTQSFYQEKRPLESQSPQIANVILSYENKDWGTSSNLSYNYTGRRLIAVAQLDGYDTYEEGIGQFDFAAEQLISSNFLFNIKLINLFSSPVITDIPSGDYLKHNTIVIIRDFNKLRGSIGLSYKF
jgi:hypothetical protein